MKNFSKVKNRNQDIKKGGAPLGEIESNSLDGI